MATKLKIDLGEVEAFTNTLRKLPEEKMKERKKFMRRQGSILRRDTARMARSRVNKVAVNRRKYQREAGQYHKSIKRGKWYLYGNEVDCIRVYSYDPIAHLIEGGWTPVLRDGRSGSHVAGKNIFKDAADAFEPKFNAACDQFAAGYKAEIEK